MSAFDGDLGPVEVKMRQIIQQQDEKKEGKDKVKARRKRLGEIGSVSLDVRTERSLKPEQEITFTEEYYIGFNKYYSAGFSGRGRGKCFILQFFMIFICA